MDCPICFCGYNEEHKQPVRTFCVCSRTLCMECLQHILSTNSCCPWDKTRWGGRQAMLKFQNSTPSNYLMQLRSSVIPPFVAGPELAANVSCILSMEDIDVAAQDRLLAECKQRKREINDFHNDHTTTLQTHAQTLSSGCPPDHSFSMKKRRSITDYFGCVDSKSSRTLINGGVIAADISGSVVFSDAVGKRGIPSGNLNNICPGPISCSSDSAPSSTTSSCSSDTSNPNSLKDDDSESIVASEALFSNRVVDPIGVLAVARRTDPGLKNAPSLFPLWTGATHRPARLTSQGGSTTMKLNSQNTGIRRDSTKAASIAREDEKSCWACEACSFLNDACLPYCEMCDVAKDERSGTTGTSSSIR